MTKIEEHHMRKSFRMRDYNKSLCYLVDKGAYTYREAIESRGFIYRCQKKRRKKK